MKLLLYAAAAFAGACVLWVFNQFLTTVAREVRRKQGGEAVADWIMPIKSIWQSSCATRKARFFSPGPNYCANVRLRKVLIER